MLQKKIINKHGIILLMFMILSSVMLFSQTHDKSIVLIVEPEIFNGIESNVVRFRNDLNNSGYNVILKQCDMSSPEELRDYLFNQLNILDPPIIGSILIGAIPYAQQVIEGDRSCTSTQFYMDLDGIFEKTDPNFPESYSEHNGKIDSEIWVSILPQYYGSKDSTVKYINKYLEKNHSFRTGSQNVQDGFLQVDEFYRCSTNEEYNIYMNNIMYGVYSWHPFTKWGNVGIYFLNSIGMPGPNDAYTNEIGSNKYKFAAIGAHGSPVSCGSLTTSYVLSNPIKPIFVFLSGCNNAKLSFQGNIASALLYSNYSNVLLCRAISTIGTGLGYNETGNFTKNIACSMFYNDKSIGEAYLGHNNVPLISPWSNDYELRYGPNLFLGDLSLTLDSDKSLPVLISSFTAYYNENQVCLEWVCESEIDNVGFIIEKKLNETQDWSIIGSYQDDSELQSCGNTSSQQKYRFFDNCVLTNEKYTYRLSNYDVTGEKVILNELMITCTKKHSDIVCMDQPYPNPFTFKTKLKYNLVKSQFIEIQVYNILGKHIKTIYKGIQEDGFYETYWHGKDETGNYVVNGTYLLVIKCSDFIRNYKIIFLK